MAQATHSSTNIGSWAGLHLGDCSINASLDLPARAAIVLLGCCIDTTFLPGQEGLEELWEQCSQSLGAAPLPILEGAGSAAGAACSTPRVVSPLSGW